MQDTGNHDKKRIWIALATWVVWILLTMFGMRWASDGSKKPLVEGLTHGRWVLLDFVDVVVHLLHPETRARYQLERLWQDAPVLRADP